MGEVRFFFDLLSPYAYLAWHELRPLLEEHDVACVPVPVLLGALLHHHGTRGPAEVPAKRRYAYLDCARTAAHLGLPFLPPPHHPFHPVLPLRVASLALDAPTRDRLIDALFAAVWAGGGGLDDADAVERVAASVGVDDAVARASEPEVKQRLREQTAAAVAAGAFGVPTMLWRGELYWGLDSLGHLRRALRGLPGPSPELLAAFEAMPVGITRGSA